MKNIDLAEQVLDSPLEHMLKCIEAWPHLHRGMATSVCRHALAIYFLNDAGQEKQRGHESCKVIDVNTFWQSIKLMLDLKLISLS